MKELFLVTENEKFEITLDTKVSIYNEIINALPIEGNVKVIEGEIFYINDVDIKFDGTERERFEIGDIVYWRSQKADRFAIAIFYGNTKFDDYNSPTAASPAIKIGQIKNTCTSLKNLSNDSQISIQCK